MSSTSIGNIFEEIIFNFFNAEINAGRFPFRRENCKIFRKKGYFSRDRDKEIIFDISIEIFFPDAQEYSMLLLIECKKYTHPVPVDDAEEFFAKTEQIGQANTKAIIASTESFQSGAMNFSKSKGIGLLRYFDETTHKWELRRSTSRYGKNIGSLPTQSIFDGLSQQNYQSDLFELFLQSDKQWTNSLWDFISDLTCNILSQPQLKEIMNLRGHLPSQVPFLNKNDLEIIAEKKLVEIRYPAVGAVDLSAICEVENERTGLTVTYKSRSFNQELSDSILGRICFDSPPRIEIYGQETSNTARSRFTLAHELAHNILDHGKFMLRDSCSEDELILNYSSMDDASDINKMEFQANYLSAAILMPRKSFTNYFYQLLKRMGISNKGFGPLYVDNQSCNIHAYESITSELANRYNVSISAVVIRLKGLELLNDVRTARNIGLLPAIY